MTLREYIASKGFIIAIESDDRWLRVTDVEALCLAVRRQALGEVARVVGKLSDYHLKMASKADDNEAKYTEEDVQAMFTIVLDGLLEVRLAALPCTLDIDAPEVG